MFQNVSEKKTQWTIY